MAARLGGNRVMFLRLTLSWRPAPPSPSEACHCFRMLLFLRHRNSGFYLPEWNSMVNNRLIDPR